MSNTYRKSVMEYEYIDVYRVLELYGVKCHAIGHAVKKLLCAGERGAKGCEQDLREALLSIERALEMRGEDGAKDADDGSKPSESDYPVSYGYTVTLDEFIRSKWKMTSKAPYVSPEDIEKNIEDVEILTHVTNSGQVLRWAILTTKSGFSVVGRPSAAVSSENDDQEVGTLIAIKNSKDELWKMMGYELKQRLYYSRIGKQGTET